jgi:dTDP-4-amino-4,6-dideoxygalactose transaminase
MKIPFLDLKIQYKQIKHEIVPAIENILENTAFILGKAVTDFENEFAAAHNVKYCSGVSSGTDGNHIALWALGVGPGDEVIIPANTFIATAWGATLCGATPVFVDCEEDSYNIDPEKVEAAITSKTKAIVAVHLYGQPADMDRLKIIADKHNLALVEDCAQAHLAEYKGNKVGGLGIISSFSFYPGKNLGAYGEGGAVTTNDSELYQKVKMMREHGSVEKYHHEIYGHNYRMEGIQGAVLGVKLKYLHEWTEGRRRAAAIYRETLSAVEGIKLPEEMDYAKHVYHLFVIQVHGGENERNSLAEFLNKNGVSTGLHYPLPLHRQNCFKSLGYKKGDFPVTEKLAETGLSLPMYPELNRDQVNYIADKIKEFYKQKEKVTQRIEANVE